MDDCGIGRRIVPLDPSGAVTRGRGLLGRGLFCWTVGLRGGVLAILAGGSDFCALCLLALAVW